MAKNRFVVSIIVFVCVVYCVFVNSHIELKSSRFLDVVKSTIFFDKSRFIKEAITHKFSLITAPRRFGKSTNLDMLREFVAMQVNEHGEVTDKNETEAYNVFQRLYIHEDQEFFYKHFGAYPVLYLDLKCGAEINSIKDVERYFLKKAHLLFKEHGYLMKSMELSGKQREEAVRWCDAEDHKKLEHKMGLITLGEFMSIHYKRKVFVLIDNYDSVIKKAMFKLDREELRKVIRYVMKRVSELCNLLFIFDYGVVMGTSFIDANILNQQLTLHGYKFLEDHSFAEFFGFMDYEMYGIFQNPLLSLTENQTGYIKYWYDGYRTRSGKDVYNPHSILSCMDKGLVTTYLEGSDELAVMFKTSPVNRLQQLLAVNSSTFQIVRALNPDHLIDLRETYTMTAKKNNYDILFTYFLDLGYLCAYKIDNKVGASFMLKVPNFEVVKFFLQNASNFTNFNSTHFSLKRTSN